MKYRKYVLEILLLPIFLNFIYNLLFNQTIKKLLNVNLINLIYIFILFLFLYHIGKTLKKTFSLNNVSSGILFYFVIIFLIDNVLLFFTKNISFHIFFIFTNFLILFLIILKRLALKELFISLFLLFINVIYVNYFFNNLSIQNSLKGDVAYQWFPMAENIYNQNYYYSLTNPIIDGYGQFISYIHAILLKLNFGFNNFEYLTATTNVFILIAILLFFELNIPTKYKYYLSLTFFIFVINSDWLNYLFINSLMGEAVVSLFFAIGFVSILSTTSSNQTNGINFLIFGCLFFTKQFVSILVLIICAIHLFTKKNKIVITYSFLPYLINEINLLTLLKNTRRDAYVSDFDFKDTILDLLTNTNLKLDNINIILINLIEDRPFTYLLIIFLFTNILLIIYKKHEFENVLFFIIFILNILLILILYISAWRNMPELDSPIRYILNLFHLTFIFTFLNLNKLFKE